MGERKPRTTFGPRYAALLDKRVQGFLRINCQQ